jgi:hypothetical protein
MSDATTTKARRTRKAHWRSEVGGVRLRFTYDPESGLIVIRQHGKRTWRTITMEQMVNALETQRLLPI